MNNIHGIDWSTSEQRIKSMKVPGGIIVRICNNDWFKGTALGPYRGPVTINRVDGANYSNMQIKSMKIEYLY